jgi:hypothetical protein
LSASFSGTGTGLPLLKYPFRLTRLVLGR